MVGNKAEEEEWLQKRREIEEQQNEWDRKIREKNNRKAEVRAGGGVGLSETRSATNARLSNENSNSNNNNDSKPTEKLRSAYRNPKLPPKSIDAPKKKTNAEKAQTKPTTNEPDTKENDDDDASSCSHYVSKDAVTFAQAHAAELIALAGPQFDGDVLGVGGLDDVIAELKRRVWTPLAAPPSVMAELGISPVRGVMLYGSSGCGKTLLARTIGKLLSPARPLTVVSGPQLMDKFVGSSEKNLRELFDNPSSVYDPYRISGGKGMDTAALHVIILDEFDAMARTRSGPDADTTAAGVARDSVVNQILSKMDGVDPLEVPTLVIAMTNRPNLIDSALLRPGRFEVQIEVPPPRTDVAREAILDVHMGKMQQAGRLEVRDAPPDGYVSPEVRFQASKTYQELLGYLARRCDGFSGASLAAVPRAAASRALERAVSVYSAELNDGKRDAIAMFDCVVSLEDLECAVDDVRRSAAVTALSDGAGTNRDANNAPTTGMALNGSSSSGGL